MFRRTFVPLASLVKRSSFSATGLNSRAALLSASSSSALVALSTPLRWTTSDAAGNSGSNSRSGNNNNNNNNNARRRNNNNINARRGDGNSNPAVLPPAFDVVHWNDSDITKGHLLRILHRDNYVVLDYYRQAKAVTAAPGEDAPSRSGRAERAVSVALPPGYVARLLAVLEGKASKAEIQLRMATALFEAVNEKGPHHYQLSCQISRPAATKAAEGVGEGGADDNAASSNSLSWAVEFDPAESLMMHRFLSQCLQYNTGFCRPVLHPSQ